MAPCPNKRQPAPLLQPLHPTFCTSRLGPRRVPLQDKHLGNSRLITGGIHYPRPAVSEPSSVPAKAVFRLLSLRGLAVPVGHRPARLYFCRGANNSQSRKSSTLRPLSLSFSHPSHTYILTLSQTHTHTLTHNTPAKRQDAYPPHQRRRPAVARVVPLRPLPHPRAAAGRPRRLRLPPAHAALLDRQGAHDRADGQAAVLPPVDRRALRHRGHDVVAAVPGRRRRRVDPRRRHPGVVRADRPAPLLPGARPHRPRRQRAQLRPQHDGRLRAELRHPGRRARGRRVPPPRRRPELRLLLAQPRPRRHRRRRAPLGPRHREAVRPVARRRRGRPVQRQRAARRGRRGPQDALHRHAAELLERRQLLPGDRGRGRRRGRRGAEDPRGRRGRGAGRRAEDGRGRGPQGAQAQALQVGAQVHRRLQERRGGGARQRRVGRQGGLHERDAAQGQLLAPRPAPPPEGADSHAAAERHEERRARQMNRGGIGEPGIDSAPAEDAAKDHAAPPTELPVRTAPAPADKSDAVSAANPSNPNFYAIIDYGDEYVQPLILEAMARLFPGAYSLLPAPQADPSTADADAPPALAAALPAPDARVLHVAQYEALDFDHAAAHASTALVNSYVIRKALIRKHYLSATVDHWAAKHPGSALAAHVKRGEHFEVDYAEFLDDALVEAFDLRESMGRNEAAGEDAGAEREWWILKPGMSDRGQGIRLFSSTEELQGIFDEWEEERPDSDDEEEEDEEGESGTGGGGGGDYITTSHLRHFVVQPYIHPPLLLADDPRKFHIRTYVLCVGSLDVYVYRPMLALFAGKAYRAPWEDADLDGHLTNTCLQGGGAGQTGLPPVKQFWDLVSGGGLSAETAEGIFGRVCEVTGDAFEAAAREMTVHFQPLGNGFEVFGLDFLVDADARPWLLEVNSFPDFKQTGGDLRGVVAGFWEEALRTAVGGFFGVEPAAAAGGAGGSGEAGGLVHVRQVELGRR